MRKKRKKRNSTFFIIFLLIILVSSLGFGIYNNNQLKLKDKNDYEVWLNEK